jgi:sigma-E factor negative regulatory protein RseC
MAHMNTSVCFEQKGFIESIQANRITVRIDRGSACGHCTAQGLCNLAQSTEQTIEINNSTQVYSVGEYVQVTMSRSMGNKAIIMGYFIPFILLIATLLILSTFGLPDWFTGLASIFILIPYFVILFIFREKLRRTFTFSIHKTA